MTRRDNGWLNILQPDVRLLDPHIWTDTRDRLSLRHAMYEGLVRYRVEPGAVSRYEPALATGWRVEDDARTWTFTVREGVRFTTRLH